MISKRLKTFFDYDDSYPTCSRTWVTFCIFLPDTTSPDELTQKLGVQASKTHVQGEFYKGKVRNWPTAWFLESAEKVESEDVRRHIDWVLEQVEHKKEMFSASCRVRAQKYICPVFGERQLGKVDRC